MGTYETTMLKLEQMAQANTATQMNWQEKMSKTSHQMEVNDLLAAGLNPVLSANQGANAYTTSVDSAVNGIAGMASAREGANATRYAARQSAAATRAAAAAQLEAARIASKTSTANNVRDNEYARLINTANNQQQKWNILNQNATTLPAAIDKITRNIGLQDVIKNSSVLRADINAIQSILGSKSGSAMANSIQTAKNFSQLPGQVKTKIDKFIKHLGLETSSGNRNLAFKGIFKYSGVNLTALFNLAKKKNSNSASSLNRRR